MLTLIFITTTSIISVVHLGSLVCRLFLDLIHLLLWALSAGHMSLFIFIHSLLPFVASRFFLFLSFSLSSFVAFFFLGSVQDLLATDTKPCLGLNCPAKLSHSPPSSPSPSPALSISIYFPTVAALIFACWLPVRCTRLTLPTQKMQREKKVCTVGNRRQVWGVKEEVGGGGGGGAGIDAV